MRKLLVLISVVLSACGGGGSDSTAPQIANSPPAAVTISTYGDSTQQGFTPVLDHMPSGVIAIDEGVGGTNSTQLLSGTDGKHAPWGQEMARSPARIVTINHAVNDSNVTADGYRANLVSLARLAQADGKVVVIETANPIVPNPPANPGYDLAGFLVRVQIQRDVAASMGLTLCDHFAAITNAGMASLQYLPDGIHPNKELDAFKGKTLLECTRALLETALTSQ